MLELCEIGLRSMEEMNQRVNKALLEVAAVVGLSLEQVHDCAERWKGLYGVDIRKPLPEDMAHLENDVLRRLVLRRILQGHKKGLQKKKRRGS